MDIHVTIPGGGIVASMQQRARFFRDAFGRDMVEISSVGSKDTSIRKVTPHDMAMFKADWDAYCDGRPVEKRAGIPLTDVPGVNADRAGMYVSRNIHNAEELASISDMQCQLLGHGVLTDRKAAQKLVMDRTQQAKVAQHDAVLKAAEKLAPGKAGANGEIAALGKKIDALSDGIGALVGLLTAQAEKKKPGRPPKAKED
jgi:hypothetical protein